MSLQQGSFKICAPIALAFAIQKILFDKYGEVFSCQNMLQILLDRFECYQGKNPEDLCEEYNETNNSARPILLKNSAYLIQSDLGFNRIGTIQDAVEIFKGDDRVMIVVIATANGENHAVVVHRAFDDSSGEMSGITHWGPEEPSHLDITKDNFQSALVLDAGILRKMDGSRNQVPLPQILRGYKVSKDDNRNTLLNLIFVYLENMLCGGVVVFKFLYCLCATHFAGAHMTWIFLLRFVQQLKQFFFFCLTTLPCRNNTNHKQKQNFNAVF